MRILILTSEVSPYHNARYTSAMAYFNEVHVIATENAGDFPEMLAASVGNYHLHRLYNSREEYISSNLSGELRRRLMDILTRIKPQAIAAAGWVRPESLISLAYGRENDVPTIVMSESQADDAPRSFLREAVKRRVVSQFDAALVGGPSHADYLELLGLPRERAHYGYNAVDNAYFDGCAQSARAQGDLLRLRYKLPKRYILASARFIEKKNLHNLIYAYADARRRRHELPDLVLLGNGPERPALERAIRLNGIQDFVHFPGFRGYDVLPIYYGLSEAFLHVSSTEQWGLVINEAMASGVPVIASRFCGATRTMIRDNVNGIVTGANVPSISDAILRLFDMAPNRRTDLARAGALTIRDWGPERFGSGLRAATDSAGRAERRGQIKPWDRAILGTLQRKSIRTVA